MGSHVNHGGSIDTLVDLIESSLIRCVVELPAGALGDALQRFKIDPILSACLGIPNADGIDFDAIKLGDIGGIERCHLAGGIGAIRQ